MSKKFSYKNIYGTDKYNDFINSKRYVINDKFLYKSGICELLDGFSVEYSIYSDTEQKDKQYSTTKAVASRNILKNADKKVYEYYCFNSYSSGFHNIIYHKNGHRYYPFNVNMYGISFLDVDTLEVYNYIPEGYDYDSDNVCRASFMIYNSHYDINSNLIAYYGTHSGVTYDVMVGDFSAPLNFNPHLVSFIDILDKYDEIDFKEFKDNRLYVLCYDEDENENKEKSLSIDELKYMINELTEKEGL